MEYTLSMVFNTSSGKKITFSITGVKSTLTETEAVAVMDNILAKNIFTSSAGDFVSKDSASIIEKKVTKLTVN